MVACGLAAASSLLAENHRITDFHVLDTGSPTLEFTTDLDSYGVLYQGDQVTNITSAVDMDLGDGSTGILVDRVGIGSRDVTFYRVMQVPVSQPMDFDNDGIHDVFELQRPLFLDPFDPFDAQQDFDDDGTSNLDEFLAGTDPSVSQSAVPAAPTVTATITGTDQDFVEITGTVESNVTLVVEGGSSAVTNLISVDGEFEVMVPFAEQSSESIVREGSEYAGSIEPTPNCRSDPRFSTSFLVYRFSL